MKKDSTARISKYHARKNRQDHIESNSLTVKNKLTSQDNGANSREKQNSPLINSPYEIFGPLLELAITPWRMFFPFAPWPVKPVKELDVIREFTGRV